MNKYQFEEARKLYPGKKRGFEFEWKNFEKKYRSKITDICPLLKPAIEAQIARREAVAQSGGWNPEWKNFPTWINGGWWTEIEPQTNKPKRTKCSCGKLSTHGIFVYFKDGARMIPRCDDCPDPEPDWRKRDSNRQGKE